MLILLINSQFLIYKKKHKKTKSVSSLKSFGFLAPTDFYIIWLSHILALMVPGENISETRRA
jgi:hypothetical protein